MESHRNNSSTERFREFFAANNFAVVGASRDREKYGNIVFQRLLNSGRVVYPINPSADEIEGREAYPDLNSLPSVPESISIVTPPPITRKAIQEAMQLGVKNIWMQPGAEDDFSAQLAREANINVIDDGSCILVVLARMGD